MEPHSHQPGNVGHVYHELCVNLIGNAAKFTEAGSIAVVASCQDQGGRASAQARFDVVDTGEGMEPETREQAFDPFFTTRSVGQGTGLGLSMVYGTVKNHYGAVELQSAPGEGTRVSVFLPACTPLSLS